MPMYGCTGDNNAKLQAGKDEWAGLATAMIIFRSKNYVNIIYEEIMCKNINYHIADSS
jgi:hypothetical protein